MAVGSCLRRCCDGAVIAILMTLLERYVCLMRRLFAIECINVDGSFFENGFWKIDFGN